MSNRPEEVIAAYKVLHTEEKRPDPLTNDTRFVSIPLNDLIKRMMAVKPGDRPSLDHIIAELRKEKNSRTFDFDRISILEESQKIVLPSEHLCRSSHSINPQFQFEILKEHLFFLFIAFRASHGKILPIEMPMFIL